MFVEIYVVNRKFCRLFSFFDSVRLLGFVWFLATLDA